jgi:hypothetical protein
MIPGQEEGKGSAKDGSDSGTHHNRFPATTAEGTATDMLFVQVSATIRTGRHQALHGRQLPDLNAAQDERRGFWQVTRLVSAENARCDRRQARQAAFRQPPAMLGANAMIPTEPIGSLPRPPDLMEAVAQGDTDGLPSRLPGISPTHAVQRLTHLRGACARRFLLAEDLPNGRDLILLDQQLTACGFDVENAPHDRVLRSKTPEHGIG